MRRFLFFQHRSVFDRLFRSCFQHRFCRCKHQAVDIPHRRLGKDETVQELISSFNAKYPDIKVTVEYLDYTNGDDQVNTAIEGGSAPDLIMEGPERLVANWGKKGVMAPLNDLWTDDAKKDIYASVESACKNEAGDYYEYPPVHDRTLHGREHDQGQGSGRRPVY